MVNRMYKCEYCSDLMELYDFLDKANENNYEIISVTQKYGYTIIYKDDKFIH